MLQERHFIKRLAKRLINCENRNINRILFVCTCLQKKQARKFIYFISDQTGMSSQFTFVSDLDNGIQELYFEFINPCSDVTGQQVWKGSQPNKCHFKSSRIQFLNLRPGAWRRAGGAMAGCSVLLTRPEPFCTQSTPWAGWRLRTFVKWSMVT